MENQEIILEKTPLKKGWMAFFGIVTAFFILLANSSNKDSNSFHYTGSYSNYNNPNIYSFDDENSVQIACQNAGLQMNLAIQDLATGNIAEAAMHLRNAYTHAPAAEGLEELVNRYNAIAGQANQINAQMYQGFGEGVRGICTANQSIASELQNRVFILESNQKSTITQANENTNGFMSFKEP